jgi:SAM-dependent methyltransferase
MFGGDICSPEARAQQKHYDEMAETYLENLEYPHTEEYLAYLNGTLVKLTEGANLGSVAEICCGRGDALEILGSRVGFGVGVDISVKMLESARALFPREQVLLVQGDAVMLPLEGERFESVFMLGGVHHVNDRAKLFSEVRRILKPGGRFYWREPVNDFFLWRWIRAFIYRSASHLDFETEHPLRYEETTSQLEGAGLRPLTWKTLGFFGFCLFMNSDVLVFNRLFRFIPGIRPITRFLAQVDDWTVRLPGLRRAGLVAIGSAEKPAA